MTNLYEIADNVEMLLTALDATNGEEALMDDETRALLEEEVAGWRDGANEKADGYGMALRELRVREELRRTEATTLRTLAAERSQEADAIHAQADRLGRWIVTMLRKLGMDALKGGTFTLKPQKNGGVAPLDVFVPESAIPARFFVPQPPKLDREALRKACEAGDPEALLVACVMDRGERLVVK